MSGFSLPNTLADDDMRDIVCCGFEAGSYGSLVISEYDCADPANRPAWADDYCGKPYPRYCWVWAVEGGNIHVVDRYGDEQRGTINRESLQAGIQILHANHPHLLAQLIDGTYDVIAADALLQAAAFGEVLYG